MSSEKLWLKLSISSLGISGIYSIFIVLLRTPILSGFFPDKSIFQTALVIHVDLSVLFWMVSFAMMIMSRQIEARNQFFVKNILYLLFFSLIIICASPFIGENIVFMNNYVPILHNLLFIIGLGVFFSCFFLMSCLSCIYGDNITRPIGILSLITCVSFAISALKLDYINHPIDQHQFYELLFWGGGHVMQFLYCSLLVYVLYHFLEKSDHTISLTLLMWVNCALVIPVLFVQIFLGIEDPYYISLFTQHMKIFGGIVPIAAVISLMGSGGFAIKYTPRESSAGVVELPALHSSRTKGYAAGFDSLSSSHHLDSRGVFKNIIAKYSTILSLFLFGVGGLIGIYISKVNVTIPAHYHGSIVGITIAIMGYVYLAVQEQYGAINARIASGQIILYGVGQFIHISALAYSGGYGALRKTPGVDLPFNAKLAMGFMGLGGLMAILSGLIFVWLCASRMYRGETNTNSNC